MIIEVQSGHPEVPGESSRSRCSFSTEDGEEDDDENGDHLALEEESNEPLPSDSALRKREEGGDQPESRLGDPADERPQSTLETLRYVAAEVVSIPVRFLLGKAQKPRRYLFDRCDGSSQYQDHYRPPCPIFYVPVFVRWFPDLLEQNPLCERFGRIGCVRPYDYGLRKIIFGLATLCQLIAFGLTFYATFAISKDYRVLQYTSFTHGMGHIVGGRSGRDPSRLAVEIAAGLLGIAMIDPDNLSGYGGQVVSWDTFCKDVTDGFQEFFEVAMCKDCASQSRALVASMIMSLLFSIPSFLTDVLRFYPDYDASTSSFRLADWSKLSHTHWLTFLALVAGQLPEILWRRCKFHQYDFQSQHLV